MKSSYDVVELKRQLRQQSEGLKRLLIKLPDHHGITDVFDYIVGALYGLTMAVEVGFVDRPGNWHSSYRPHLTKYVENIVNQERVNNRWLAGFYFNSGIQRIAACFDRIPKLLGAKGLNARQRMKDVNAEEYTVWAKVYEEINAFKHDAAGRASGRTVSLAEALQAFDEVVKLLQANEAKLMSSKFPSSGHEI